MVWPTNVPTSYIKSWFPEYLIKLTPLPLMDFSAQNRRSLKKGEHCGDLKSLLQIMSWISNVPSILYELHTLKTHIITSCTTHLKHESILAHHISLIAPPWNFPSDFWETDRPNSIWYTASGKRALDMVELFKKGSRFTKSYHLRYAVIQGTPFETIQMAGEVEHKTRCFWIQLFINCKTFVRKYLCFLFKH